MSSVLILSHHSLTVAPPSYYYPDENGVPVPVVEGARRWVLLIDQSNVPEGATYDIWVEFQRHSEWTDPSGELHPAGEWIPDYPGHFLGARFNGRYGPNINWVTSQFGSLDASHNLIAPYPDNVRLRIDAVGDWVFPFIELQAY